MTSKKKRPVAPRAEDAGGSAADAQRLLLELCVHQIELETQNEELRRVQRKLDASLSRDIDFYNRGPVGYCTVSEQGLILEADLTLAAWLGTAPGSLVKQNGGFITVSSAPGQGATFEIHLPRHARD